MRGKADGPPDIAPARPRVLFEENAASPVAAPPVSAGGPAVLFGVPRAPAPKSDRPRVLASGEIRSRIPCDATALREIDATVPASVLTHALRVVEGINVDDHYFDDVVRFGAELQADHGRLAGEELAFVENEALARGRQLSAELLQYLSDLDPETVFAARGGLLQHVRAFARGRGEEHDLATLYPRIQSAARNLDALAPEIRDIAERLRSVGRRYERLDQSLSAHILAGRFLLAALRGSPMSDPERRTHYASQAEAIETRIASLAATRATVDLGRHTVDALAQTIDALAWCGQDLVREDLPAWHTAYATALLAAQSSSGGTTALGFLRDLHARISAKLIVKG